METFATYYAERVKNASEEQGIDALIIALKEQGINATSEQTGGFTMCAYIELSKDLYIYANSYGAGLYGKEDFIKDICQFDERNHEQVAQFLAKWIKENKK
jgi:hypothetical protein